MEICFATNNPNKLKEIRQILGVSYTVKSLKEIGCHEELPETGDTLEANSLEKAKHVFDHYHVSCFADDTGLEVDALSGAPGVYSARYAGPACNAEDNMQLLLSELKDVQNRKANFRTVVTLIIDGNATQFEGAIAGEITVERSGAEGFGYDPIFKPAGETLTFAEMDSQAKNSMSHRKRAIEKLAAYLAAK